MSAQSVWPLPDARAAAARSGVDRPEEGMGEVGMAEYRIDELARAVGTTSRNVRAYQERGLLPPPARRSGRALIYDDTHLARLQIIDSLLQRGFTIAHIADFITGWENGKDLTEILGLQHAVTARWGKSEEPLDVPRELVDTILGASEGAPVRTDQLERLAELELVRLQDDTVRFLRPELLETFAELSTYGFDLSGLTELYAAMIARLEDIASLMVTAGKDHIVDRHGPGWLPDSDAEIAETTRMLNHLRELGARAVRSSLDQALDRVLQRELGAYLATAASQRSEG